MGSAGSRCNAHRLFPGHGLLTWSRRGRTGGGRFNGDGGPATKAELSAPEGVTVDGRGDLLIADSNNQRVRMVAAKTGTFYGKSMHAGDIYTVAGSGTLGFSGDHGPATEAKMYQPSGAAVDGAGNLVIADSYNKRVRVVAVKTGTFYGQAMTAGDIYTIAGEQKAGSGDGGPATAAELGQPKGVAVDTAGNMLVADTADAQVRGRRPQCPLSTRPAIRAPGAARARIVLGRDWAGAGPHGASQPFAGPFLRFLRGCSMIASGPGNTRLV